MNIMKFIFKYGIMADFSYNLLIRITYVHLFVDLFGAAGAYSNSIDRSRVRFPLRTTLQFYNF